MPVKAEPKRVKTWTCRKKVTSNEPQRLFPFFSCSAKGRARDSFFVQPIKCCASKAYMIHHLLLKRLALWPSDQFIHSPQKLIQFLWCQHTLHQEVAWKTKEYEGLNPESSLSSKGPTETTESSFQQKYLSSFEQANKSKTT